MGEISLTLLGKIIIIIFITIIIVIIIILVKISHFFFQCNERRQKRSQKFVEE
jgi:hypothetical protein